MDKENLQLKLHNTDNADTIQSRRDTLQTRHNPGVMGQVL
jgi:hypothetical protein